MTSAIGNVRDNCSFGFLLRGSFESLFAQHNPYAIIGGIEVMRRSNAMKHIKIINGKSLTAISKRPAAENVRHPVNQPVRHPAPLPTRNAKRK